MIRAEAADAPKPCPFSPYSDVNVRDSSLKEAIASPLFKKHRSEGVLSGEHVGGCVLYEKREVVKTLAAENSITNQGGYKS